MPPHPALSRRGRGEKSGMRWWGDNYEIPSFERPFAKLRAYSGQALRSE